jgi:peptidoglycan/xylan/chitin deacetylase (PgdA/CDA1 family)
MFYFAKTPNWLKTLYKDCTWDIPSHSKTIYLTFDDGPHPVATPFVLDELSKYNAKATFFCIGKNVGVEKEMFNQIITKGHAVGNHTFDHLNGWKTDDGIYLNNIAKAEEQINSNLFRPPYGRIKRSQIKKIHDSKPVTKIIMWDVLSGDFDKGISREKCLSNVIKNAESGSIVVFHDSEKAFEKLVYALPEVLEYFTEKGYRFEKITF